MPLGRVFLSAAVAFVLTGAGCAYNPKESSERSPELGYKGTVECLYSGCHDIPALSWAPGSHANLNAWPGSAAETCADCHDPIGDSQDSALIFTSTAGVIPQEILDALGPTARPIVGCEGCHGSGMEHYAYAGTALYYGDHREPLPETVWPVFGNVYHMASCGPCHSPDEHSGGEAAENILTNQYAEWWGRDGQGFLYDDGHSDSLVVETPQGLMTGTVRKTPCAACHTVEGFVTWFAQGDTSWGTSQSVIDRLIAETGDADLTDPSSVPGGAALSQVSCVACHPSHEPGVLLRSVSGAVSGTQRRAALCMECHNVRGLESAEGSGQTNTDALEIPRHPQRELFLGFGDLAADGLRGVESLPGFSGTDSVHAGTDSIAGGCTGCHYLRVADENIEDSPGKGTTGHAFSPRLENCFASGCHTGEDFYLDDGTLASWSDSTIASFDFGSIYYSGTAGPGQDHDGDGDVEPFQEEVAGLLDALKKKLTDRGVVFDTDPDLFDLPQMAGRTATERAAAYNYDFVVEDKSLGYHNPAYVVDLLKASISALP